MPTVYCQLPAGYVNDLSDCDDGADEIHPGALELCNGIDDNCDTLRDESFECVKDELGQCGTTDVGECAYGTRTCSASCSWGSCEGNIEPLAEVCDGLDNNCNGQTDEGNPGGGAACDILLPGVCSAGLTSCVAGSLDCQQVVFPGPEVCGDFLDNDCDGFTDGDDSDCN